MDCIHQHNFSNSRLQLLQYFIPPVVIQNIDVVCVTFVCVNLQIKYNHVKKNVTKHFYERMNNADPLSKLTRSISTGFWNDLKCTQTPNEHFFIF